MSSLLLIFQLDTEFVIEDWDFSVLPALLFYFVFLVRKCPEYCGLLVLYTLAHHSFKVRGSTPGLGVG